MATQPPRTPIVRAANAAFALAVVLGPLVIALVRPKGKGRHGDQHRADPREHSSDDDEQGISKAVTKPDPSVSDSSESHDKAQTARDQVDRTRLHVEIVGAVLLFMTGGLAGVSACYLKQQTDSIRDQSDTLRQQVHAGQRAYVIPTDVRLLEPIDTTHPVTAIYSLTNSGATIALNVTSGVVFNLVDARLVILPNLFPGKRTDQPGSTTFIGPNTSVKMAQIWINSDRNRRLTDAEMSEIRGGSKRLYLMIATVYRDIFNQGDDRPETQNLTSTCFMYDITIPGMIQCRDGNYLGQVGDVPDLFMKWVGGLPTSTATSTGVSPPK